MTKNKGDKLGSIVFIAGLILAIIIALIAVGNVPSWAVLVLAILGIIVGLVNIADKEVNSFLIAAIAFLISFSALGSVLTTLALGWAAVGTFFNLMAVFVAPATAIVAIVSLFKLAKD